MQQYFVDEELFLNKTISLNEDIVFHLTKVLRNTEKQIRLVDPNGNVFLATYVNNLATIIEKLDEQNILNTKVTAIISLIKQDKFEIILQKLTELGVDTIIPLISAYSQNIVFSDNKIKRFNKIMKEASEQSHRNYIPKLLKPIKFKDIVNYKSKLNIVAYEKQNIDGKLSLKSDSITFIIGPEGGFKNEEIVYLKDNDYISISLGRTILRAETAAICLMSNITWDNI